LPIRQLRKVKDYVTEHLAEEISIERLAELQSEPRVSVEERRNVAYSMSALVSISMDYIDCGGTPG
jgi:hypothetical protein